MNKRLQLQKILEDLIGNNHVYYQPPAAVRMKYPAIKYSRSNIEDEYANNNIYIRLTAYMITVIDSNPDSEIVDKISKLPLCRFNRHYTADGFNYDVFILYF